MVNRNFKSVTLAGIIIFSIFSCISGKIDENGRYVPKRPNYSFKDKKGHIEPTNLDLENVYKLNYSAYTGEPSYPLGRETYPFDEYKNQYAKTNGYFKFYTNGRCLDFGKAVKDALGNENTLSVADLDPSQKDGSSRQYYFSKDGKKITIEGFYPGDGGGIYLLFTYHLNITGDTLTRIDGNYYEIYVKEILPDSLKRDYEIDW